MVTPLCPFPQTTRQSFSFPLHLYLGVFQAFHPRNPLHAHVRLICCPGRCTQTPSETYICTQKVLPVRLDQVNIHSETCTCARCYRLSKGHVPGMEAPPEDYENGIITPEAAARHAVQWVKAGASIVGGCCGMGPKHIAAISQALKGQKA